MHKSRLLFLLPLSMILSCCIGYYSDLSHLYDEELQWINCYNVGDTVIFQSDNLKYDTLVVDYKKIENSENRFFIHYFDDYMGDSYNATAMYAYYIKSAADSIRGNFKITKLVEKDSIEWSAILYDRFSNSWPYEVDSEQDRHIYIGDNPIKVTNINFNGKKLNNCITFSGSNSRPAKYKGYSDIDSFIISRDYGLIYYKYTTGEEFYRQF